MLISSKGRSLSSLKIGREGYFWAHQIDPNCLVERFTQLCKMICPHVICFNLRYSTIASSFIIYSSHPSSPSIDLNGKPRHSFCSSLVPRNSRRKGKAKEHVHNLGVERQKIKEQASLCEEVVSNFHNEALSPCLTFDIVTCYKKIRSSNSFKKVHFANEYLCRKNTLMNR